MSSGQFATVKSYDDIKNERVNDDLKPLYIQACLDAMVASSKRVKLGQCGKKSCDG